MCCLMRWKKRLIYSLHVSTLKVNDMRRPEAEVWVHVGQKQHKQQRSDVQEAQRSMLLSYFSVVPSKIFNWSFWVCLSDKTQQILHLWQFIHLTEEFFHLEAWSTQSEAPVGTLLLSHLYLRRTNKVLLKVQIEPSHLGINYEKE